MLSLRSAAVALSALSLLSTVAQAGDAPMSANSITKLFPGHFEARVENYKVLFSAHRNGRLVGSSYGLKDKGQWYVRGQQLCVSWKQWTKGKAQCGYIWQRGKWYVANNRQGQTLAFRPVAVVASN